MAANRDSSAALTKQKKLTERQREYLESKEEPLSFRPKINRNYKDAKPALPRKQQICE